MSEQKVYTEEEVTKASLEYFGGDELAADVVSKKYLMKNEEMEYVESTPEDKHNRLAKTFARIEKKYENPMSKGEIFDLFDRYRYIVPQGSPMFGVGNPYQMVSVSNCFVIDCVDSYGGICRADERLAQISKRRGGCGMDISPIRPKGMRTNNSSLTTDGITLFMNRFSNTIREVGQCIAEGERVLTDNGMVAIEEIRAGDKVWTKEGWIDVVNTFSNGVKKVFKVTTVSGYSIRVSEDHILGTGVDEDGNIVQNDLKSLDIGDNVLLLCGGSTYKGNPDYNITDCSDYKNINNKPNNCDLSTEMDTELAYVLGYSYGDGYVECNKNGEPRILELACANDWKGIKDKLLLYIYNSFGYSAKIHSGDGAVETIGISNKCIVNFLDKNGFLKQKSHNLEFPHNLFNCSTDIVNSFISGYFDADGYASGKKKGYVFSSVSLGFLKQIQTYLMSIGIASKIHCEDRSDKGWRHLYSLAVVGCYAKKMFLDLMIESVKVQASGHIGKRDNWLTPYSAKSLDIKYNDYNYVQGGICLSVNAFDKLKKEGVITGEVLLKDQIIDIEECGSVNTYDIELAEEHLFWCEGFYVHNSGRRGALLLSISVHHPEIMNFIMAKSDSTKVTGANISVRVTDEFMEAVKRNKKYEVRWPVDSSDPSIKEMISAKEVWDKLIELNHKSAEPGILFWDNIIKNSPADCYQDFGYKTLSTNPCGELPLSKNSSCILMLLNLSSYVENIFTKEANFNLDLFQKHVKKAMRLMDDLVDIELESISKIIKKIENDPEPDSVKLNELTLWKEIQEACANGRRTGLGITALGDCIAMMGYKYGDKNSFKLEELIYSTLRNEAYRESVQLAKERGAFPVWNHKLEKDNEYLNRLPDDIKIDMKKYGRRNISLLTTPPAGSVSVLTQTSSGFEPVYKAQYFRKRKIMEGEDIKSDFVDEVGDKWKNYTIMHHGLKKFIDITGKTYEESPYCGSEAGDIDTISRVRMQALATSYVDHSISSTLNLKTETSIETISELYFEAWKSGCKGLTIYRDGSRDGVLTSEASITRQCDDCDDASKQLIELIGQGKRPQNMILSTSPQRSKVLECDIHRSKVGGGDWLFFIGKLNNQPYEVFGGDMTEFIVPHKYKHGWIEKNGKVDGVTQYNLVLGSLDDENEKLEFRGIAKHFNNYEYGAFTRLVSLTMRHGTPIKYVCEQITKKGVEGDLFSFQRAMSRILKKYIVEGEKSGLECPDCGSPEMVYRNGCPSCMVCGHSKCS